jgi:hypothetical protein
MQPTIHFQSKPGYSRLDINRFRNSFEFSSAYEDRPRPDGLSV